jgi:hypothetical protein
MNCRTVIFALLHWPLAALHAADARRPAEARPNLVFVFNDQESFDMLGCADHKDIVTPNLDKFAAEVFVSPNASPTRRCARSRGF